MRERGESDSCVCGWVFMMPNDVLDTKPRSKKYVSCINIRVASWGHFLPFTYKLCILFQAVLTTVK